MAKVRRKTKKKAGTKRRVVRKASKRRVRRNPAKSKKVFSTKKDSAGRTMYMVNGKRVKKDKWQTAKATSKAGSPSGKVQKRLKKRLAKGELRGRHVARARKMAKDRRELASTRGMATSYLKARSIAQRAKKGGYYKEPTRRAAQAFGLTRINPSNKAVWKDLKTMLPMVGVGAGAFLGMTVIGAQAAGKLAPKLPVNTPEVIVRNIAPIATAGVTAVAWWAMKRSKKMQKWSAPVLLGGGAAVALQLMLHSKLGQQMAAKIGLMPALAGSALGAYTTVPGYMGDYVDAGPQEAFGAYVANDFPVHTPGPGDSSYTTASLGEYDDGYGPEFIGELELTNTPGGTALSGASAIDGSSI